jgi:hypothetical protein
MEKKFQAQIFLSYEDGFEKSVVEVLFRFRVEKSLEKLSEITHIKLSKERTK